MQRCCLFIFPESVTAGGQAMPLLQSCCMSSLQHGVAPTPQFQLLEPLQRDRSPPNFPSTPRECVCPRPPRPRGHPHEAVTNVQRHLWVPRVPRDPRLLSFLSLEACPFPPSVHSENGEGQAVCSYSFGREREVRLGSFAVGAVRQIGLDFFLLTLFWVLGPWEFSSFTSIPDG